MTTGTQHPAGALFDLPEPVNRAPAPDWTCWSCGRGPGRRSGYCTACETAGRNNPWLECTHAGCNNTTRRSYRGQQYFTCNEHERTP
jgi:hypothetical protein